MEVQRIQDSAVSYGKTAESVDISTQNTLAADAASQITAQAAAVSKPKQQERNGEKSPEDAPLRTGVSLQMKQAVEEMNKSLHNSEAIFGIHEDTNRVTIKIIDKETKEVLKEYPPEKTLDMIAKVWETAGIRVDQKL